MLSSKKNIILHLSLIDGIGPATIQSIITNKKDNLDWSDLYQLTINDFKQLFGLTDRIAQKLFEGLADTSILEKEFKLIERNKISFTTVICSSYPSLLREIHLPPSVLYWQGEELNNNQKNLAIIGSRKANRYGKQVIDTLVPELVSYGYTIVSGGALGADTMAHEAAIKSAGKTIVVLGSGLLYPYPSTNKKLFKTIVENGGTLFSSFPLLMQAQPGNFPARNRIISGLSHGCLVVQAAKKSGASITAHFALEQGREVFAVPGPINDELSAGCHRLIQQGAKLVTNVEDILHEFGEQLIKKDEKCIQRENRTVVIDDSLTEMQRLIITICAQPISIDEIVQNTNLDLSVVQTELFNLQLDGKVQQDFTGMWITN